MGKKTKANHVDIVKLVSQYDVPFENILDDRTLKPIFQEFLKMNLNEEPYLFMTELDYYVTLIGAKARYKSSHKIAAEFLELNAPKAINISNKLREEARSRINQSSEDNCPKDLFDEIRLAVYLDLKQCSNGFLDSELFRNHVAEQLKQDPDYMNSLGTIKDEARDGSLDENSANTPVRERSSSTKTISDIYDPTAITVTDEDFQRVIDDICNKEMWSLVFKSDKRSVLVSKNPAFNGKRGLKRMVESTIFPYPIDEVFFALIDDAYQSKVEKGIHETKFVQCETYGKYMGAIYHSKYKFPLMKKRDFVILKSCRKEPNGYCIMRKSVSLEQIPEYSSCIRAFTMGGVLIEKIDDNTTRVCGTYYADLGGFVTPTIYNKLMTLRDDSYYKAVVKACKERRQMGIREPLRSNHNMETLLYHIKHNK
jgi:hypothetical protein